MIGCHNGDPVHISSYIICFLLGHIPHCDSSSPSTLAFRYETWSIFCALFFLEKGRQKKHRTSLWVLFLWSRGTYLLDHQTPWNSWLIAVGTYYDFSVLFFRNTHTVDGKNPTPVDGKYPIINRVSCKSGGAGCLPSTVSMDMMITINIWQPGEKWTVACTSIVEIMGSFKRFVKHESISQRDAVKEDYLSSHKHPVQWCSVENGWKSCQRKLSSDPNPSHLL